MFSFRWGAKKWPSMCTLLFCINFTRICSFDFSQLGIVRLRLLAVAFFSLSVCNFDFRRLSLAVVSDLRLWSLTGYCLLAAFSALLGMMKIL
jgi:hypothetical protein